MQIPTVMMNNPKVFLSHVLNQIIPASGLLTQTGSQWKFAKTVPGLEALSNRTFVTQTEAIDAVTDYYIAESQRGQVTDLPRQGNVGTPEKKAV